MIYKAIGLEFGVHQKSNSLTGSFARQFYAFVKRWWYFYQTFDIFLYVVGPFQRPVISGATSDKTLSKEASIRILRIIREIRKYIASQNFPSVFFHVKLKYTIGYSVTLNNAPLFKNQFLLQFYKNL